MKKLLLLLLLSVVLSIMSCTSDKEETCDCSEYAVAETPTILSKGVSTSKFNETIQGSKSLTINENIHGNLTIKGDLNLNGYHLKITQGCLTVENNLNGPGKLISTTYYVAGSIQNSPSIVGSLLSSPCGEGTLGTKDTEYDPCRSYCLNK